MGHLVLPGGVGEFISAADIAAYDLNDTFFVGGYYALDDWTPAAISALIGMSTVAGGQKSYLLRINTTGKLQMVVSQNGVAAGTVTTTNPSGFTDGTGHWVGADFDGGDINFYVGGTDVTAPSWAVLTGPHASGEATCHNSTGLLEIGSINGGAGQNLISQVHRAVMYSDLARTVSVFDADFTDLTAAEVAAGSFVEDSPNAAVVTINGVAWSYVFDPVTRRVMPSPRYGITRMARR